MFASHLRSYLSRVKKFALDRYRSSIFRLFDTLLILDKDNIHANSKLMNSYIEKIGSFFDLIILPPMHIPSSLTDKILARATLPQKIESPKPEEVQISELRYRTLAAELEYDLDVYEADISQELAAKILRLCSLPEWIS